MRKIAIVVASCDGLTSLSTGVGIVVNNFIESFEKIKNKSKVLKNHKLELICLAPYLDENSKDYNREIKKETEQICEANKGRLVALPTLSDGSSQHSVWGGPNQWRSASLSAASYITAIHDNYDLVTVLAHDTIFSSIRKYAPDLKKMSLVWVPHSLGLVFEDEFSDSERLAIERESIGAIQKNKLDAIGYIGDSFKEILHKKYGLSNKKLAPFVNGIYKNSSRFNIAHSAINKGFKDNEIPMNKKIIFCSGRCVQQKGYDILIPAYGKFLRDHSDYHLVSLMPLETSVADYVNKIKKQISMLPEGSMTAIYDFKENLPYIMLNHPNLDIVVFPSKFEGSPLAPLEALSFTKNNVKFVYSTIPQHVELFKNNDMAIPVQDLTINRLYGGLKLASKKTKSLSKKRIVTDFVDSYVEGLDTIIGGIL